MTTSRKKLIIGNWKMHNTVQQSSTLVARLHKHMLPHRNVEVVIAPGFLSLQPLSLEIDRRRIKLASQDGYYKDEGAVTGEVSFAQLRNIVHYSLVGHSERRIQLGEGLDVVQKKVEACVRNGITPVLCIGETTQERRAGETKRVLHDQIVTGLANLTAEEVINIVIAYEPVWAIGTGVSAKPYEIHDAVAYIRSNVQDLYGCGEHIRVLYGAGVEPEYVQSILGIEAEIDGLLVGSASLNWHKFVKIVEAANRMKD